MKLFLSKIRVRRISHSKILASLISLCFFLLLIISFNSNAQEISKHSTFTIEKAKDLFSQTRIKEFFLQDRSGEAEYSVGIHMKLGWDNGSEYHSTLYNLDVIEVPILESNLSKTFQVASSTLSSNGYENNGQKESLLFTRDASGNIKITILKISGTIGYLAANNMKANSFRSIDSVFEGFAAYYNLEDSLLKSYVIKDKNIHEVVDSHEAVATEDRWGLCIIGWITLKNCTGNGNHTCDNQGSCECKGGEGHCNPPVCLPIMTECGGPPLIGTSPGTSNGNSNLPEPPGSSWGSGSSTTSTGTCNCAYSYFDQYFTNVNPELIFPYNNYWFNLNYVLLGTNCRNGNFTSGTYKAYLVPGQPANGQEIEPSVAMDYCELDNKVQLGPCKWQVETHYSGNVTFSVSYSVGPWTLEDHRTYQYERWPIFVFE